MKKVFIIIMLAVALDVCAQQPHYAEILKAVEANNPMLLAAQKHAEARQAAAKVGVLLQDPEVEAAYFWGDPAEIGIRWDLSVSQTFEMPSVLVRRAHLRDLEQQAANLDYQVARNKIFYEAQQTCADYIYYSAVAEILDNRTTTAARLAQLYQKRFDAGDCSILEYNRAQMYLAQAQREVSEARFDVQQTRSSLFTLAGDAAFAFGQKEYDNIVLPLDFDTWYQQFEMNNPSLRMLDNQVSEGELRSKLSRAQWLPSISVGYASENIVGETFRGVKVGLSLPIWSQQRAARQADLEQQAAQQELVAQRDKLARDLLCLLQHMRTLQSNLDNLRSVYDKCNSLALLDKALEAGEINLEQYLVQADYYVDIQLQIWQLARQLEQAYLQLNSITL